MIASYFNINRKKNVAIVVVVQSMLSYATDAMKQALNQTDEQRCFLLFHMLL